MNAYILLLLDFGLRLPQRISWRQSFDVGLICRLQLTELWQLGPELLDRRGVVAHHDPPKAPAPPAWPSAFASKRAETDGGTIACPPSSVKASGHATERGYNGAEWGDVTGVTSGEQSAQTASECWRAGAEVTNASYRRL